jgi:hypothetical protein
MAVYVSWGNDLPRYDKSEVDYNSPKRKWDRYSENMKRGYVLYHQSIEKPNQMIPMGFIRGLMDLERYRQNGFKILKKKPKNDICDLLKDIVSEQYHQWGIEGDDYSPENNPFSNINLNK